MTGYLGMPPRTVAAVTAAALTVGVTLGLILPTPNRAPCGYVVEGAEVVPAACQSEAELLARLDAIRAERSGGRW
jgi:hypothetical protein